MRRLALLLAVALVAGACGGSDEDTPSPVADSAPAEQTLSDLTSVDQLKERFNADQGVPRLILLVSPT
jgi:ABC-type glycerol-3-phosphate transport system substrate-binding protein